MPSVKPNEKLGDFLDRCVSHIMDKEGLGQSHAVARCTGIHRQAIKASEALILDAPDGDLTEINELQFEKELIYEGEFTKDDFSFGVDQNTLNHWADKVNTFVSSGIEIPIAKEHSTDPDARLGSITSASVKVDSHGRQGLFVKTNFVDKESAKVGLKNQVSLYSPPKYKDSSNVEHVYPIRHVAVTSYPVVNKLDGYMPIAASFSTPVGGNEMPKLLDLAGSIGLKLADNTKEDDVSAAILEQVTTLQTRVTTLEKVEEEKKDLQLSFDGYKTANPVKTPAVPVSDTMKKMIAENREMKLSALVEGSKISPLVKQKMIEKFCTVDGITLVLSENHNDRFDDIIDILTENNVVQLGSDSFPQGSVVRLSRDDLDRVRGTQDDPNLLTDLIPSK